MANRNLLIAIVALGGTLPGLLLAQTSDDASDQNHDWEMFSQNVAAAQSSTASGSEYRVTGSIFLYNKKTGKVFRVFEGCGELGQNGCVEAIPVLAEGHLGTLVPAPQAHPSQLRK